MGPNRYLRRCASARPNVAFEALMSGRGGDGETIGRVYVVNPISRRREIPNTEWIRGANSSASSGLGEFACGVLRTQIILR
jgi:hypothetical protein